MAPRIRRSFLIPLLVIALALPSIVSATTWSVRKDGLGDFTTIQAAIDAAVGDDVIEVWPDIWTESLTVRKRLTMQARENAPVTVIDGGGIARCLWVTGGGNLTITGFSLINGFAYDGAGIHVDTASRAILQDCILRDNVSTYTGGAGFVRHSGSVLTFQSCSFIDNTAPLNAGGVGISLQSQCFFIGCEFRGNRSDSMAGAIANFAGSLMFARDCRFLGNSGGQGGAVRIYDAPATILNCSFFANESPQGSIYVGSTYDVVIQSNIISSNPLGHGIVCGNDLSESRNIFFANASGPAIGFNPDPTDLKGDPHFCDPAAGDLAPCADSIALQTSNGMGLIGALPAGCDPCGDQLALTLTGSGAPIQIPAGGGEFSFDVEVTNLSSLDIVAGIRVDAVLPDGSIHLLKTYPAVTFPAGATIRRSGISQTVPGAAPVGTYAFRIGLGTSSDSLIDLKALPLEKLPGILGLSTVWTTGDWIGTDKAPETPHPISRLDGAVPNPFNPRTTFGFSLASEDRVTFAVFDLRGREVKTVLDGVLPAGTYSDQYGWDGTGPGGSVMPSGVYFLRMVTGSGYAESCKIMMLK
ncbi:MAG: right-handed parallel beta-helix repeat-containing protein [Candidatus Krumholzibacteriia bacterium]